MTLYRDIADLIRGRIRDGEQRPGSRLPGVRRLAHQHGVSVSTMVMALQTLEDQGWVEARARSGFFVRRARDPAAVLPTSAPPDRPMAVTSQAISMEVIRASGAPGVLQFGTAVPDADFLPMAAVRRALSAAQRALPRDTMGYAFPPGVAALREQIALRLADGGVSVSAERVLITAGAQEAIQIALRAVTRPGDIVAVESPCYYGLLQVIESLGLEALEIPTDTRTGIDLSALTRALERWPIRALALVPQCSNPTGYVMADGDRRALVELCTRRDLPVIEDDVYADLTTEPDGSGLRPRALKATDAGDRVFLAGSASKTVAPGLRLGWLIAPECWRDRVEYLKYAGSLSAGALAQQALAQLYEHQGITRHLRVVRDRYAELTDRMADRVLAAFPDGTAATRPAGGFVIWVRMPEDVDALALYRSARSEGIVIAPGPIFSASGRYEHCLRLNAAVQPDADVDRALVRLGVLAERVRTGSLAQTRSAEASVAAQS